MYPRVTAIVVARNGGAHLGRTLDALAAQTRPADAVVAIDCGSTDDTESVLAASRPTQLVSAREPLAFGAALAAAIRVLPMPESDQEFLWFLAQDSAPDPHALEALIAAVEVSPSVAVAGPKLMDWDDSAIIREFGQSMTPLGASAPLVEDELDQAQHDGLSDVLAVAPAGMLVRHVVWERLGGFDPALASIDDSLDFCVRVRLAGFRVEVVGSARVLTAGDGIAGPSRSLRTRAVRRRARERRAAALHRRLVYSRGVVLPLHWLSLVPLAFVRSIGRLLAKQPGLIGGEFRAAFRSAFAGRRIGASRHSLARQRTLSWTAIAPLRIPLAEVRRARALRAEAAAAERGGERPELNFFAGGGAWTVLGLALVGIALFGSLLGAGSLAGGGLLPLSDTVGALWQNVGYGWRDVGPGFVGAADPFSAVLAVLGSVTFWQPSFILVLLYLTALPIAGLGAWLAASRLTSRSGLRAFAAITWALGPMLFAAMQSGRPADVLVHLLLPWLFYTGIAASRSWAASAGTALLAAAVVACSPSLAPALLAVWILCLVLAGRRVARFIVIPLPALVLFAPLVWQQAARGAWLSVFADPGVALASRAAHPLQLALGFPDGTLGGWEAFQASLGLSGMAPLLVVPVLMAPIGILAVLALFLRGSPRAIVALLVALFGFLAAVGATLLSVTIAGIQAVAVWPGAGLSLYWIGLVGAATIGLAALGRFAVAPALVSVALLAVAVAPSAIAMPTGASSVSASDGRTLPAVVTADASGRPRIGTLELTAQPNGGISESLIRGSGATLDDQSTLASTDRSISEDQRQLAVLAGNLASQSGFDASSALRHFGIGYILLAPASGTADSNASANATDRRTTSALDGNPLLTPIGQTSDGTLWSFGSGREQAPPAALVPQNAGGAVGLLVLIIQAVIVGGMVLLAIPTGRGRGFDPILDGPTMPARDPSAGDSDPDGDVSDEADGGAGGADATGGDDASDDDEAGDGEDGTDATEDADGTDDIGRSAEPHEAKPVPDESADARIPDPERGGRAPGASGDDQRADDANLEVTRGV